MKKKNITIDHKIVYKKYVHHISDIKACIIGLNLSIMKFMI